jgi:DNA-binding NtrC family response regulator
MRAGASDYLIKPVTQNRLLHSLRLATDQTSIKELQPIVEELGCPPSFDRMVGADPVFRGAVARAAKVARGSGNILVQGEKGTGRNMLARAIHASSSRSKMPFKLINVRSVAPEALASTLFGHERGAAGATDRRIGLIEQCTGGTLVLCEVNRLAPDMQHRLQETLATGRVQPLGAPYTVRVDVRVIAARNVSLGEMSEKGKFDANLHRALSSTFISLPPLRARSGDIPALARHFLRDFKNEFGLPDLDVTEPALELLAAFAWPGNVGQLQSTLWRAALLCKGDALTVENFTSLGHLDGARGLELSGSRRTDSQGLMIYSSDGNLRSLEEIEADVIRLAMGHYRGRMAEVARRLGVGRSTLYRKIAELGIVAA